MAQVSVVIPAYNRARYLPATLQSMQAQTMTDWEAVIVDDGSTDDTIAVAQTFVAQDPRIRLVKQPHAGISAARNRGWDHISPASEFLIFLDSDDVWKPHALATFLHALNTHPDALGAHALAQFIDENGHSIYPGEMERWGRNRENVAGSAIVPLMPDQPTTFATLVVKGTISTTGLLLLRRQAAERAGRYDPQVVMCEDWDFWLRVVRQGPLAYVDEVLLGYRWHGQNISTSLQDKRRWERLVRHKLFQTPENTAEQREMIREAHRVIEWRFCMDKWPLLRQSLRQGQVRLGVKQFGYTVGHFARYMRSQP